MIRLKTLIELTDFNSSCSRSFLCLSIRAVRVYHLIEQDKQFPVEQFEASRAVGQAAVPHPLLSIKMSKVFQPAQTSPKEMVTILGSASKGQHGGGAVWAKSGHSAQY